MICSWITSLLLGWDASATVASLALLVAFWAAKSAKASAEHARIANHNYFFSERYEVFKAFQALFNHILQSGTRPDFDTVNKFFIFKSSSKVLFSEAIVKKIEDYFDAAFRLADEVRVTPFTEKIPDELMNDYRVLTSSGPEILESILAELKAPRAD